MPKHMLCPCQLACLQASYSELQKAKHAAVGHTSCSYAWGDSAIGLVRPTGPVQALVHNSHQMCEPLLFANSLAMFA